MSKVKESTKIKVIREDLGYTQEQFAEIFNMTLSGYKKVESGEVKLTVDKLYIFKEKWGISADYVLFDTNSELVDVWGAVYMLSDVEKWKMLMRLYSYLSKKFKGESMAGELLEYVDKAVEEYLNQQNN